MTHSRLNVKTGGRSLIPQLSAMIVLMLANSVASAAIYRCTSDSGVIEYSNTLPEGTVQERCTKVDLPSLTTIPAPTNAPATRSSAETSGTKVPQVGKSVQHARENDRRRILKDELRHERAKIEILRGEYKNGEPDRLGSERNYQKYLDRVARLKSKLARRNDNIDALKRELGALK